jgi:hypothetical protein
MRSFVAIFIAGFAVLVPAIASADEPTTEAKPEPKGPVVELSADEGNATIEKRTGTSAATGLGPFETGVLSVGHWQEVCVAPCQVRLDPNSSYRVSGDGLVPSGTFMLPRNEDRVRVDARMGSSPARVGGMLLTAGGIGSLALGGLALLATPILASEDVGSEGFRTGVLAGGIGAVSVGAIALTTGLFLWLSNGSSAHPQTIASSR